jgi:hypothetical protein
MKIKILTCILLAVFSLSSVHAQKKRITITGHVTDGTNSAVANAIVMLDGNKTSKVTNEKGFYKIKVKPENSTIGIFTYSSGVKQEPLDGRTTIDFTFEGSVSNQPGINDPGDEVIDIGYGKVKKRNLTSNVSKIDGTNPKYASYRNIYDMLRGEVPGVQVNGTSIRIQGASSLTLSTEPLFVVDGVTVNSIDHILPQMVKSIQ